MRRHSRSDRNSVRWAQRIFHHSLPRQQPNSQRQVVLSKCLAKFCLTWKKELIRSPTRYTRIGKQKPTTTENSPTAKQCTELRSTLENFPNFTSNLVRQRSMYSCGEPVAHASRVGGSTLGAKLSTLIMNPREDLVPLAGVLTQLRATARGQGEGDMPRVDPGPLPIGGPESTLLKDMSVKGGLLGSPRSVMQIPKVATCRILFEAHNIIFFSKFNELRSHSRQSITPLESL
jgi:hypothetical protein